MTRHRCPAVLCTAVAGQCMRTAKCWHIRRLAIAWAIFSCCPNLRCDAKSTSGRWLKIRRAVWLPMASLQLFSGCPACIIDKISSDICSWQRYLFCLPCVAICGHENEVRCCAHPFGNDDTHTSLHVALRWVEQAIKIQMLQVMRTAPDMCYS